MAVRAVGCGKGGTRGGVDRVVGLLPGREVATGIAAVGRSDLQVVVVIDMARSTGNVGVPVCQRETRERVVEVRRIPTFGGVAVGAISRREDGAGCGVNRVVGLLPGREVATGIAAVGRSNLQVVIVVDVAGGAGNASMTIRQRKTGGAVVELRIQPGVERVAGLAGRGEVCGRVIGISGLLKIAQVAGHTGRRQSLELANGCALVALLARHGGVSAEEGKAILVILDLLHGNLPAQHRVALRAVGAEFTAVNIGVAIGAILSDVGENRPGVALRAFHFFVHATERVAGFIVIEFRDRPDGPPSGGSMAIFARYRQWTVRTSGGLPLRESQWSQAREREEKPEQEDELVALERNCPLTREHTEPRAPGVSAWYQFLGQKKMQTTVRRTSLWPRLCTGQTRALSWTRALACINRFSTEDCVPAGLVGPR